MYTNCEVCQYPMTDDEINVVESGSFGQTVEIYLCDVCKTNEVGSVEQADFEEIAYNELTEEYWNE